MNPPDCTYCGAEVVVDIDMDGPFEVCTGCGTVQGIADWPSIEDATIKGDRL